MKLKTDTAMSSLSSDSKTSVGTDSVEKKQQTNESSANNKRTRKKTNEKTATFLTQEFLNASQNGQQQQQKSNGSKSTNSTSNNNKHKVSKSKSKQKSESLNSKKEEKSSEPASPAQKRSTVQTENKVENHGSCNSVMSDLNKILKNKDIKTRYWSYLLASLKRAIDEIYFTCENDESISSCKVKQKQTNLYDLNLPIT